MPNKTFKEMNETAPVEKEVKKAGLSLAIIFSKEDIKKFKLKYGDIINLDNATIIS